MFFILTSFSCLHLRRDRTLSCVLAQMTGVLKASRVPFGRNETGVAFKIKVKYVSEYNNLLCVPEAVKYFVSLSVLSVQL